MTEEQPYLTVRTEPDFELRRYPQHIVAEVTVRANFDDAGNRAFRFLFGYISGDNTANQKLAMTSPVVQSPGRSASPAWQKILMTAPVVQRPGVDADSHVIAFVLPAAGLTPSDRPGSRASIRPTNRGSCGATRCWWMSRSDAIGVL